jgi:outer membrane protein assembly factor BamB
MRFSAKSNFLTALGMVAIFLGAMFRPGFGASPQRSQPQQFVRCWQRSFAQQPAGDLEADAGVAYIPFDGAAIKAVDLHSGEELWNTDLGGTVVSNLLANGTALYVASGSSSDTGTIRGTALRSISKQTGVTNWSVPLTVDNRVWLMESGPFVIAVSESGSVAAVARENGDTRWQTAVAGPVSAAPALSGDRVAVATSANKLQVISTTDGSTLSILPVLYLPATLSFVFDGKILAGDVRGNLSLFDSQEETAVWTHKTGAQVSSIVMSERGALVGSFDNFVYMFSHNGDVLWKRRLPARPGSIVLLGAVAVLSTSGGQLSLAVDLKDGKVLGQLSTDRATIAAAVTADRGVVLLEADGALSMFSTEACPDNQKRRPFKVASKNS